MPNMSQTKVPVPEQEPKVRARNFEEVTLGYTKEMAMEEAARCLNCKNSRRADPGVHQKNYRERLRGRV